MGYHICWSYLSFTAVHVHRSSKRPFFLKRDVLSWRPCQERSCRWLSRTCRGPCKDDVSLPTDLSLLVGNAEDRLTCRSVKVESAIVIVKVAQWVQMKIGTAYNLLVGGSHLGGVLAEVLHPCQNSILPLHQHSSVHTFSAASMPEVKLAIVQTQQAASIKQAVSIPLST